MIVAICLVIIVVGVIFIMYEKRKTSSILATSVVANLEQGQTSPSSFNNKKFNDNILNETTIGILGCVTGSLSLSMVAPVLYWESEVGQVETILTSAVMFHICGFSIFPIVYFARHPQHVGIVLDILNLK